MTETDVTVRPRAVHLLEYLAAVRSIREQPVRDVAQYQDKRWWAADIPEHPACVVTATGEGPWLRVAKASVPAMPVVPADIAPYLVTDAADPRQEPAFSPDFAERFIARRVPPVVAKVGAERSGLGDEEVTGDHDETGHEEAPEIARARAEAQREAWRLLTLLRDYVDGPWRAWAEQAIIALDARTLYDNLFELRQRLQRESAFIELVWGHGILSWIAPDGTRVQHPLVTTQAQLEFDAKTGAISVEPDALLPHHLDIDLLRGLRLDGFGLLLDVREGFRESPVGPFDPEARDLYDRLLAPLGQDGEVRDATRPPTPDTAPVITASWILMVRRRSTMYQRFFNEIREALESGQADVAAPIVSVIADEPGKLDEAVLASEDQSWQRAAERLLMPLPTNPEQEQVARRLAEHRGVTVQGPPGTGKTHTIANLISHLVGHGKRVL
ncbi:MAG TPA: AAA domain-containing protein, partial [Trebonia sp.]|nr:AAA domain-containing protein [Trebonia sp.]